MKDLVSVLGEAWTIVDGQLCLESVLNAGMVESAEPEVTEPAPVETEPAPETTEPPVAGETGDSAFVFVMIGVIALVGAAVVAKRREN